MRRTVVGIPVAATLFLGCNSAPPPPPFNPVADVKELMQAAIDPMADEIWEATGVIMTAEGDEQRRPKNDEEWARVKNAALIVAESGNLLMMVPRAKDGDLWMKRSQELINQGIAAMKAAQAKNVDELFTVGGDLYEACSHCHQEYMDAIKNANR